MKKLSLLALSLSFIIAIVVTIFQLGIYADEEYENKELNVSIGEMIEDEEYNVLYDYNYLILGETISPRVFNLPSGISINCNSCIDVSNDGVITALKQGGARIDFCNDDNVIASLDFYVSEKLFYAQDLIMGKGVSHRIDDFFISNSFYKYKEHDLELPFIKYDNTKYNFEYDNEKLELTVGDTFIEIKAKEVCDTEIVVSCNGITQNINVFVFDIDEKTNALPKTFIDCVCKFYDNLDNKTILDFYRVYSNYYLVGGIYSMVGITINYASDISIYGPITRINEDLYMATYDPESKEVVYLKLDYLNLNDYEKLNDEERESYRRINEYYLSLYGISDIDVEYGLFINIKNVYKEIN